MALILALALFVGAFIYYTINYFSARKAYKTATKIQRWNAAIEDAKEQEDRQSSSERFRQYLRMRGWNGGPVAPLLGVIVLYALCAVILSFLGLKEVPDAIVSFVATWIAVVSTNRRLYDKRREKFRRQLLLMITMLGTQIKDLGTGPTRALAQIVPQLEDPLGTEMTQVLAQVAASRDLVEALTELSQRYPSRAFTMFILTLEMSDTVGGVSIAPTLERLAATLQKDFDLTEEAHTEVAQTKAEFYAVTAIVAFICFILFEKSGSTNQAAYTSSFGIIALVIGLGNYAWGIWRVRRALAKAKGRD